MSDEMRTSGNVSLECDCGWSFDADTESLAYKRKISHEDLCDGEVRARAQ